MSTTAAFAADSAVPAAIADTIVSARLARSVVLACDAVVAFPAAPPPPTDPAATTTGAASVVRETGAGYAAAAVGATPGAASAVRASVAGRIWQVIMPLLQVLVLVLLLQFLLRPVRPQHCSASEQSLKNESVSTGCSVGNNFAS